MKLDALLDRLVQDLTAAAQEDAEAAAAQARLAAEQAAEAEVAAARAEGEARLSAAQAVNAGLLEAAEGARREFKTLQTTTQIELDRVRTELEGRLKGAEEERTHLALARDAAAASLEAQTRRSGELEETLKSEARRASQLAEALEAEKRRATELDEAARADARRLRELDDALKVEMRRAREIDEVLKAETRRTSELAAALDAARQQARAVGSAAGGDAADDYDAMLGRVSVALKSIDRATSPGEILETLIDPLAQDFATVGIFLAGASSFRGWRGQGFGASPDISDMVLPRAADSLLTRAAADRARVSAEAGARKPLAGLSGSPVARALALPVLAQDRVIAVVYAEDPDPARDGAPPPGAGCRIAEMLIDHATLRLTARQNPSTAPAEEAAPANYSPARAARRVRIKDPVDVTLDGTSSSLVDLSVVGAQVLSPNAMRPNRVVRMTLRAGRSSVACKGRVVWARFEQPQGTAASQYRVGVKFTESEPQAIETFLTRHGVAEESGAYAMGGAKAAI